MGAISVTLIRFAIVIGFFALWEIASGRWIEPFLISSPSRIFTSLISGFREGDLLQHSWVTLIEIAIGFPIGAIAGIGLGYAFGRSRVLADIFEPIIIALNGIPRTALAPLFIVWLGIGVWSKVGVVFLLTFFLNFFNTYTGMRQMDQEYVEPDGREGLEAHLQSDLPGDLAVCIYRYSYEHTLRGHRRHRRRVRRRHRRSRLFHPHVGGYL